MTGFSLSFKFTLSASGGTAAHRRRDVIDDFKFVGPIHRRDLIEIIVSQVRRILEPFQRRDNFCAVDNNPRRGRRSDRAGYAFFVAMRNALGIKGFGIFCRALQICRQVIGQPLLILVLPVHDSHPAHCV